MSTLLIVTVKLLVRKLYSFVSDSRSAWNIGNWCDLWQGVTHHAVETVSGHSSPPGLGHGLEGRVPRYEGSECVSLLLCWDCHSVRNEFRSFFFCDWYDRDQGDLYLYRESFSELLNTSLHSTYPGNVSKHIWMEPEIVFRHIEMALQQNISN